MTITNGITLTNEIKDLGDLSDNINTVLICEETLIL